MGVLGASWPLNIPGYTLCLTCSAQNMCAKAGGGWCGGVLSLGWVAEDHYQVCGWDSERQGEISGCSLSHLQSPQLPNQKPVKKT